MAAGFNPSDFWTLTPRLYVLHMDGARDRIERDIDMKNRLAWNTAALVGAAMAGKMPSFDKAFGKRIQQQAAQSAEVLDANLRALAIAWGATE